jgi:hypothetical protein
MVFFAGGIPMSQSPGNLVSSSTGGCEANHCGGSFAGVGMAGGCEVF